MPRRHLGLQQDGSLTGGGVAQFGHPLRGFDVQHPRVMQRCHRENARIVGGADVLVGRVRLDVVVNILVFQGISPLIPLGDGER
ncbi:Uncharacterised protein [Mycobacteroides abscessus subsp. abscessus]|nr:Uncharacterised protein [Mycobacteroides abscessus subsp. abscessus]